MAREWRLLASHMLAHINPTLTTGTAVSGFPITNIRTLNPNIRARGTTASNVVYIDFDRGTASNLNTIDCAFIAGASRKGSGYQWGLWSGTTSTPADARVAMNDLDFYVPQMYFFTGAAVRYWRVDLQYTGTTTFEVGVVTAGKQYLIPGEFFGSSWGPPSGMSPNALRSFTASFRRVPIADAKALQLLHAQDYILRTDYSEQDGLGCANGLRPMALGCFSSTSAAETDDCYYGNGMISVMERDQVFADVNVTIDVIELGPLN